MYAIVNINGIQTRVMPDEVLNVPRLVGEPGAKLTFNEVLLNVKLDAELVLAEQIRHSILQVAHS